MKALVLISDQEPHSIEACMRMEERKRMFAQEVEFMKKNIETKRERYKAMDQEDWKGLLEDYDRETHHLSLSVKSNLLAMVENENEHPLSSILKGLS